MLDLTKQDNEWNCTTEHLKALDTLKERLTCDTVMAYYDPTSESKLVAYASIVGLGAIFVQHDKGNLLFVCAPTVLHSNSAIVLPTMWKTCWTET